MVDAKRIVVLVLVGMFLVSFMAGFVGGATPDDDLPNAKPVEGKTAEEIGKEFGAGIISFVEILFGETGLGNESLSRLFMAILIAMFVYTALGSFFDGEKYKWVRWIATVSVTILAIVGLPDSYLEAIRTNYRAMGATILSVIPFLIIFWFTIKVKSFLMARIIWLFYALYYLALYFSVWWTGKVWFNVYLLTFIAGIIIFFSILKIRRFIFHGEMEGLGEALNQQAKERKVLLKGEKERLNADRE